MYLSLKYSQVIKCRRLGRAVHVARIEEYRNAFKILTRKPTGKRLMRRWEDNIRMDLKEIDVNTRNWIDLAQDRDFRRTLVIVVLNLQIP